MHTLFFISLILAAGGNDMLPKMNIETYRLQNGLTVFLLEDHTIPIVAVDVNYHVGSKNETEGKRGFAHLFEHIMFQGSKHFNDDYFKALQDIGGEVNGATNQDRTRYYEILPSSYLERALWLESDRMGFLLDALNEERLQNQISVVSNEYRQNYENAPYGMVYFEILKMLYPPHHPYSWPTIGYLKDIQSATLSDVKKFFETYYAVNNASIAIAGDINKEETKRLVEKYFGGLKPAKPIRFITEWSPQLTENKKVIMKDRVNLPRYYLLFPTVKVFGKYDAELDIIAKVLGQNENSRLYKRLVKEKKIASEVTSYQSSSQIAGYFGVTVTLYPNSSFDEVRDLILQEINSIVKYGITKDELTAAQNYFKSDFIRGLKRLGGFGGITDRINYYYQMLGRPDMFEYDLKRYIKASNTSVKKAALKYLNGHYAEIYIIPQSDASINIEEINRDRMPTADTPKAFKISLPEKTTLPFGPELYYIPYAKLPLNYITILLPRGASLDGDREGLANLTANMLLKGTKDRSSEEIQSLLDRLGSTIDVDVEQDYTSILITSLTENIEDTIRLLSDILLNPLFDKNELKLLSLRFENLLLRMQDQPSFIAGAALIKQYFEGHPYGHFIIGNNDFLKSVTKKEIADFYNKYYTPENAKIIYTGNIKREKIVNILNRYLSAWKRKGDGIAEQKIYTPKLKKKRIIFADRPQSTQSVIIFAMNGVMRTDKNFESAYLVNTLFGGYFLSRLNMRLREEKGFTYGARSGFRLYKNASIWTATTSVQADATINTIKEILNVISEMKSKDAISPQEIERAKGYLLGGFPIKYETIDGIHNKYVEIVSYNLPLDTIDTEYKRLQKVERSEIENIIRGYFTTEDVTIVVVGDRKRIFDGLKTIADEIVEVDRLGNRIRQRQDSDK